MEEDAPEVSDIDPVEQARSRVGTLVDDKYRLLDLIGLGATGAVYKAENRWAGRVCAVKLFHYTGTNEHDVLRRFVREAQAIHRVQKGGKLHPHVVDAIDVGRDAETGCFFVVQELLRGETLASYLERQPSRRLSLGNALRILSPVVDAIACAHEAGVVHRDLKPENILLTRGPNQGVHPKVLDFGIAQIADERVTPVTDFMGTPQYMPPEAFGGASLVDARGDVWALAVILYEMVSGVSPFAVPGDDPMAVMELVKTRAPTPLTALGVATPTVWNVLRRALLKPPSQRYANARELLDALEGALRPVRVVRVTPGMTLEQVQRATHDPARQGVVTPPRSMPPAEDVGGPRSMPPRPSITDRRSMYPRASMSPPANDASPEAPDATFTGDPVAHWWSVHFLAGGHTVDEVVEVLSLPELAHVVELHITGCPLGDAGLEQLVEGPWLRNLSVLSLCRVGVTARGLVALARCQSLTGVVRLDLEQNAIGTDGLRTLLAARHLSSLRQLGLVLTGLDAGAADALVESAKLARLHRLDLSQNLLGDDGVATLADFDRYNPELQLVVARNRVSQDVASAATAAMSARVRKFVV